MSKWRSRSFCCASSVQPNPVQEVGFPYGELPFRSRANMLKSLISMGRKVSLFVPCFVDQLLPEVAVDTVKVLRRIGCEVNFPEDQTCCGQPAFNTGYWDDAR